MLMAQRIGDSPWNTSPLICHAQLKLSASIGGEHNDGVLGSAYIGMRFCLHGSRWAPSFLRVYVIGRGSAEKVNSRKMHHMTWRNHLVPRILSWFITNLDTPVFNMYVCIMKANFELLYLQMALTELYSLPDVQCLQCKSESNIVKQANTREHGIIDAEIVPFDAVPHR